MSPFWREGLPLRLETQGAGPRRFHWHWRWHRVDDVLYHWRIHTDWWTDQEIWRDYWELTTDTGLLCTLYCDLLDGEWYLERVYE